MGERKRRAGAQSTIHSLETPALTLAVTARAGHTAERGVTQAEGYPLQKTAPKEWKHPPQLEEGHPAQLSHTGMLQLSFMKGP